MEGMSKQPILGKTLDVSLSSLLSRTIPEASSEDRLSFISQYKQYDPVSSCTSYPFESFCRGIFIKQSLKLSPGQADHAIPLAAFTYPPTMSIMMLAP